MTSSAGLLMYRQSGDGTLEVMLAHPGGPYWQRRDAGAWTIPKGEYETPETPLEAACREFSEETGFAATAPYLPLGDIVQKGGKRIRAWAVAGNADPALLSSNSFEIEWPPRSGRRQHFPEIDRVEWFSLAQARSKLNPAQAAWLDRLADALAHAASGPG